MPKFSSIAEKKSPVYVVYIENHDFPFGFEPLETSKDSRELMKILNTHPERKKRKLILDRVIDPEKPTKLIEFEQYYQQKIKVVSHVAATLKKVDPDLSAIFSKMMKKIEIILQNIRRELAKQA